MDKDVLVQYREMKKEVKDLRRRIEKLNRFLADPPIVSDTVKGTRKDGTIGPIKVTGIPDPEISRKQRARERYRKLLEAKEAELLELIGQAEEYIGSIKKSEIRIMLRLYCIDGLSYIAVARKMNSMFPGRRIKYTDENVRKRIYLKPQRSVKNILQKMKSRRQGHWLRIWMILMSWMRL